LSVLVVDDSPDVAGSTADLLALAGHRPRVALGGEEALRLAAADPPDVVLLDLRMPGLDGCEVARRLADRWHGRPPVLVAVTACGTTADRAQTAAAGFHLHLVKPVDPAVLIGMLRRFHLTLVPHGPAADARRQP
jgi:CheY-like chemotaxis protein